MTAEYKGTVRPELQDASTLKVREIFADDYMLCIHNADTAWGSGSYHNHFSVDKPSAAVCSKLSSLVDKYFPI